MCAKLAALDSGRCENEILPLPAQTTRRLGRLDTLTAQMISYREIEMLLANVQVSCLFDRRQDERRARLFRKELGSDLAVYTHAILREEKSQRTSLYFRGRRAYLKHN